MIEFILKYWLEILFTIISSSVGYMIKGYMSLKNGLKALLKNEIIRIYEKYMELGYCPNYMKDNISEIYKNYQHFEGDRFAKNMVDELYKLPSELTGVEESAKENIERQVTWQSA